MENDTTHSLPARVKVITGGMCNLILTMGLARFAYTPLLPVLRAETGLDAFAGGWLASLNYVGYLAGALVSTRVHDGRARVLLYRAGLVTAVLATAGMGATDNVLAWAVLRFLAGLSTAAGMFIGSGLVLGWLLRAQGKPGMGLHFAGIGIGIVISALAVAAMSPWLDHARQWLVLGALGAGLLLPAWILTPAPMAAPPHGVDRSGSGRRAEACLPVLTLAYFCAGFSYVIGATFLVAMVDRAPGLSGVGGLAWMVVGASAAACCAFWDRLARRFGDEPVLLAVYALHLVSFALPMLGNSAAAWLFAASLFGATFLGIVSLTLAAAGRASPGNPGSAMARLTLSYGVAQIVAPSIAGYLARSFQSYRPALLLAAAATALGLAVLGAGMARGARVARPGTQGSAAAG